MHDEDEHISAPKPPVPPAGLDADSVEKRFDAAMRRLARLPEAPAAEPIVVEPSLPLRERADSPEASRERGSE
jgi:hypothetical protein